MRNDKNHSGRCTKQTFSKHPGICRTYSPIQLAYAEQLEADPGVKEFQCNVPLQDFELTDGSYMLIKERRLADPCKAASILYWKATSIAIPVGLRLSKSRCFLDKNSGS